jgi:lipoprotein-anchoring transpeptidase ErfK/SrfK
LTTILSRIIAISALMAGMSAAGAVAAPAPLPDGAPAVARDEPAFPLLAQGRDIDIFYDQYGRRVIMDAYTGEVLAVERPRRTERRVLRVEPRSRDRYYLDDPADVSRLERERRNRLRQLDRIPREDFRDGGYLEGPVEDYPDDGSYRDRPRQLFPDAPRRAGREADEPRVVTREPLTREPLAREPLEAPAAKPKAAAAKPAIGEQAVVTQPSLGSREDVAALQILLDRKGASPGVIDGRFGSNVDKAIAAYRAITGENLKSTDPAGIKAALAASGGEPFTSYTITNADAAGPFVASVPADYGEKAKLERMSFTSTAEMLAERFHMDEAYLKALNPDANFNRPGTIIKVANVGKPAAGAVKRIVADKGNKQVRAYDAAGKLLVAYPATIGSSDTPSPTGVHAVSRIAFDPEYTYNPKLNFKQGDNDKVLTIPPGPNGPVGSIWIALDKPTYGIHGTPEPSKIGKTESHGCVRLTNWDAAELAKMVSPGVNVEFVE